MRYEQALGFLNSFLNYEQVISYRYPQAFSLNRMQDFLKKLGNPHERFLSLHVAGTKGKGSTCAFAASILQAMGRRVGLYTSPHLLSLRERFQVDGQPIAEEELAEVVEAIRPYATRELTFFEVTTACAFLYFAKRKVDVAAVEVGLGGRLDATNVLAPLVAAITPISFDHVEKLGPTLEEIASEKAGIIKQGIPVVTAPQPPEALAVLERTAAQRNAPLHLMEKEVSLEEMQVSLRASRCTFRTPQGLYRDLEVPLLGRHQLWNAAVAIRMVELLENRQQALRPPFALSLSKGSGQALPESSLRQGLSQTRWPGRCQWMEGSPSFLLDGAQNAASARALRQTVEELFLGRRLIMILGFSLEKDLSGIAEVLGPWEKSLILTKASVSRAEDPFKIAAYFSRWYSQPIVTLCVADAIERAREKAQSEDLIVVTGSLFVVAEALQLLSGGVGAEAEIESRR